MSFEGSNLDYDQLQDELTRQLAEKEKIQHEMAQMKLFYAELEATNNHLVAATWRERDMKKQLADTISELQRVQAVVEDQNRRISESINYAKRIQTAINATEIEIQQFFPESFVVYKPKDVLSGDFPWCFKNGDYLYVAAVDCTGHGVPGAMMSMIGNLLLKDIVNSPEVFTPAQVLFRLHEAVVNTLKQDVPGADCYDGMDLALCRINLTTNEFIFAGSHRPLLLKNKEGVSMIDGDHYPIGGISYKGRGEFVDHKVEVQKGDSVLIFSDGYIDQFGGPKNKRIMTKGLRALMETCDKTSMSEVKIYLDDAFDTWKGSNRQTDDVLVVGIRF
ncbi:MAG: PP2C family protein-serine/threonine phosphatase [Bacteroidia bacterium]